MIGTTVGPYRILEQLGQGGMGIVYRAQDDRLGRRVALKFLPPQLSADARSRERFVQEARAASALDHANICTIHDIGQTDDGRVYIVMAFYEGRTLKYRLDDAAIPFDEAVDAIRQLARGLGRAHEAGIVHRDVKPANIMVTDRGEVKILDFGLAKLATSADLTREGSTIGTAAYMSPEQSRGEAVDARSDLWSAGVVAYEMLTGRRPFGGGYDAAMLYAILNEEAPAANTVNPAVPEPVARVVQRCLAKDPAGRFPDMGSFLGAFEEAAGVTSSGATTSAPAATAVVRPGQATASPVRIVATFAAAAVATLAVVYAAMIFFGLPDWVFSVGIGLLVIGLPVVLYAGSLERRRADMGSGERRELEGVAAWFSLRRATWGGVGAMAALGLFAALWMGMRALGIGPAGTLLSRGALSERDFVVMSEFENRTQDENLAASLTEAFRIDLSQSQVVNLVDGSRIRDALVRMRRDPDTRLTRDVAREVALRTGAKAVVVGDVSSIGRSFALSAGLLSAEDGVELVALRENAEDDGAILSAVDRLSGRLRERVGESLVDIRGGEDLEAVTTSSLEALRLYSEGYAVAGTGDYARSEELLLRAVEIDSTFAMAWRKLAVVRGNSGRPLDSILEAAHTAYRLRERLTERERLLAEANYFNTVVPDEDRVIAAYEAVLEKWPDDLAALNNLALEYSAGRRFGEAEALSRRVVAVGENVVFRQGLIRYLALQNKWDEVEPEIAAYIERYPRDATPWVWLARIAVKRGEFHRAPALLDSAEARIQDVTDRNFLDNTRATIAQVTGNYATGERLEIAGAQRLVEAGFDGALLGTRLDLATNRTFLSGDLAATRRAVDDLVRAYPLAGMNPRARPDGFVAAVYAHTGDPDRAEQVLEAWRREVPAEFRPDPPYFAEALIALRRGDRSQAIRRLETFRAEENCADCAWGFQGLLYEQMDSAEAAIAAYERHLESERGFDIAEEEGPIRLHLGALYDLVGNPDRAIENYSRFAELWKDADPDLQPYVRQAQAELNRLLRETAREPSGVPAPSGS